MLLDVGQKLLGIRAIDDAMIEAKREVSHVPNCDVVLAIGRRQDLRALFNLADPQDGHLRLTDDWRAEQSAKHARICNREGASSYIVRFELLGACTIGQIV